MSARPERRRFTRDEYLRMIESGILGEDEKVELVDGEIISLAADRFAMSPQSPLHSALVARIGAGLSRRFPEASFCVRHHSPLALLDDYVPEPDIAVIAGPCDGHASDHPRTALLVIEVSIASRDFDRGRKSDLYAKAGVIDYWIVDVTASRVEVRRDPTPAGYRLVRLLSGDDEVLPVALEGTGVAPLRAKELLPRTSPSAD